MTKILVNNEKEQIIFDSYQQLTLAFETTVGKIQKAEEKGTPLIDMVTGQKWYVDKLFE